MRGDIEGRDRWRDKGIETEGRIREERKRRDKG
jgi:hypothetical protein